ARAPRQATGCRPLGRRVQRGRATSPLVARLPCPCAVIALPVGRAAGVSLLGVAGFAHCAFAEPALGLRGRGWTGGGRGWRMAWRVFRAGQAVLIVGKGGVMRGSFLKGAVVGLLCALLGGATVALAGSGVGGVFNLGVSNSVNAKTTLTGATAGA